MTTISFAENTTYQVAASFPGAGQRLVHQGLVDDRGRGRREDVTGIALQDSLGELADTPGVSFDRDARVLRLERALSARIGPASESAWNTSSSDAIAAMAGRALSPASKHRTRALRAARAFRRCTFPSILVFTWLSAEQANRA